MTLVEAVKACRWPSKRMTQAQRDASDDACRVVLDEAKRQGRRLSSDLQQHSEDAASRFTARFTRLRKKPAFASDDAVRGFIYVCVWNECLSMLRGETSRRKVVIDVDTTQLRNASSTGPSIEGVLVAPDADTRFGPHEEAAHRLLPSVMEGLGNQFGGLRPAVKLDRGIFLSTAAFHGAVEQCRAEQWPQTPAERRAFQRALRIIRVLLPDYCQVHGLAPADIVDFLRELPSLRAQEAALWDGTWAGRDELDPRVAWFFTVAANWQERCRK